MQKRLISYSTILLTTALIFGCSSADRIEETSGLQIETPDDDTNDINTEDDDNTTIGTITIDAKNAYKVSVTFSDTYNQRGYYSKDEIGQLDFNISNIYTNEIADASIIESITLEAEEKSSETSGKYFNFITYTGEEGPTYSIPKASVKTQNSVALRMEELSGTTNIILTIKLEDFVTPYTLKVPLIIEKNKSSSMAIVPIGSRYEDGLFIDKFVIHVVDSYGNKAQDGTYISTGVINNPKLYSNAYDINSTSYLDDRGTLDKNNTTFTLPANSIDTTDDLITSLDTLILLSNQDEHKPTNIGGWDITSVNSDSQLSIINLDQGNIVPNVSYVVGDEYRYDSCSQTILNAAASTFESTAVVDGIAYAELRYVPEMVGKNIFIYANSRLEDKHLGISRKVLLHGTGLASQTLSCTNDKGLQPDCHVNFRILQNDSGIGAHKVNLGAPVSVGQPNYTYATASDTDCHGWATISIFGIDENETASVSFGSLIRDEILTNQR